MYISSKSVAIGELRCSLTARLCSCGSIECIFNHISGPESSAKKQKMSCEKTEEHTQCPTESEKSTADISIKEQGVGDDTNTNDNASVEGVSSALQSDATEKETIDPCDSDHDSDVVVVIPPEEETPKTDKDLEVDNKTDVDVKSSVDSKPDQESSQQPGEAPGEASGEAPGEAPDTPTAGKGDKLKDQEETINEMDEQEPGPSGHCQQESHEPSSGESQQSSSDEMPRSRERPTIVDYVAKHIEHIICSYGKLK